MESLKKVTKDNPCPHCGKPDWCYEFPNGSTVCNRGQIGLKWVDSGKKTKTGLAILYPESWQGVKPKPEVIEEISYDYTCRLDGFVVRVIVQRLDDGNKLVFQKFHNGKSWLKKRPKGLERADIHVYRYVEMLYAMEQGETIFICEGEKCVEALRKLGLAAITNIQGCKGFSESDLQDLGDYQHIVLIPDRDRPGIELMEKWAKHLPYANWLYPYPQKDWVNIPPDNGMDIADWISDFDLKADDIVKAIVTDPIHLKVVEPEPDNVEVKETAKKEPKSITRYYGSKNLNSKELLDFIDAEIGDRLSFDEFNCQILLDGKELQIGKDIDFWFVREFGETSTKDKIAGAILNSARQNSFHPIKLFLEECRKVEPIGIKDIATRYFGTTDPVCDLTTYYWLISAIARAIVPGAKVDYTLCLQGGEGAGKTSFFETLFDGFFTNSITKDNFGNPNSILTAHMVWCSEFAEIDAIIKSKHSGLIKGFLTTREDLLRKPYGYDVEKFPRPCIFAGTVNPKNFLDDSESNRRFWPIGLPENHTIPLDLLRQERMGIFHAALLAYESGVKWWPQSEEEETAIARYRRQFFDSDAWNDVIASYIANKDEVSIMEILTECLGFADKECKRSEQNRVVRILTANGFTSDSRRVNRTTGAYERTKKRPSTVNLTKTSGHSGHSGQTITEQGIEKNGNGHVAVNSGHDHSETTTTKSKTLIQTGFDRVDHIDHINSVEIEKLGGVGKQQTLTLDQSREDLLQLLTIALKSMDISVTEAKGVMAELFNGRCHTAQLTTEEIKYFLSFIRGETYN